MSEKILPALDEVPQTLLVILLVRARETPRPDGVFKDEKAVEIVKRLEADFSKINLIMHRHDKIAVFVRMKKFDKQVREFLVRNPEGVVHWVRKSIWYPPFPVGKVR